MLSSLLVLGLAAIAPSALATVFVGILYSLVYIYSTFPLKDHFPYRFHFLAGWSAGHNQLAG